MRPWDDGSEGAWSQFGAFEKWFRGHREGQEIEMLLSTLDMTHLYAMFCDAYDSRPQDIDSLQRSVEYHEMAREICGGHK